MVGIYGRVVGHGGPSFAAVLAWSGKTSQRSVFGSSRFVLLAFLGEAIRETGLSIPTAFEEVVGGRLVHERRLFEVNRWGKDHDELLLVRASKSKQCGDFGRTGGTTRYGRHNLDAVASGGSHPVG